MTWQRAAKYAVMLGVLVQVAAGVVELSLGLSGGAGLLARRDAGADVSLTRWLRGAVTPATCEAYVLRRSAQVFGHNAPLKVTVNQNPSTGGGTTTTTTTEEHDWAGDETTNQVFLDGEFANLRKGDLVVVDAPPTAKDGEGVHVFQATSAAVGSRAEYALTGRATRVTFAAGDDWRDDPRESGVSEKETVRRMKITPARRAMVYVGAEALALATRPVVEDVAGAFIDLDGVFDELPTGRLLFVEGERTDVAGVDGVRGVELVTVGSVSTMTREPPTDGPGGDADEPSDEAVDEGGVVELGAGEGDLAGDEGGSTGGGEGEFGGDGREGLVDDGEGGAGLVGLLLERVGERDHLGRLVELTAILEALGPGEDRRDRVGRGRLALLVHAIVARDGAVRGFGFHRLSVRSHQDRSHETQRTEPLRHDVGLNVAVVVFTSPYKISIPFKSARDHIVN